MERVAVSRPSYPRDLAVRVLTRVLSERQPLDESLAELGADLDPQARAWLQDVCSGTLRWKGRLDWVVDSLALRKKPSGWLRKILLVGAYQLVAQERTQPAAVVSETVAEIKKLEGEAPSKFANAILRKVADHAQQWRDWQLRPDAPAEEAAAWASLPVWMWRRFEAQHGRAWAAEYAHASLQRPALWIRVQRPDFQGDWAYPGPVPGSYGVISGGQVTEKAGFDRGDFFVQDISSQVLIHEISRKVRAMAADKTLSALDLCAAPGGKSIGLFWNGMKVTASDRDEARLSILRDSVERAGRGVRVVAPQDLSELPEQDLVWVDAPCTGSGILRRHPDVRWLRQESELPGLLRVQQQVLDRGWKKVRPGGFLAYSVCSVFKEEGLQALEKAGLRVFLLKEWFLVPQFAPCGDGFWAGLLRKPSGV